MPYSIEWLLYPGGGVKVISQCTVQISIRKYSNIVNCDVIEMDAYSIMLIIP